MEERKEQQTNQGWLRRFLQREQGNHDTIATQVGGDVQGANVIGSKNVISGDVQAPVVLGSKNVIQIGNFSLPIRFILALLVVIVAGLLFAWLRFVPAQMSAAYNLAIAEFGEDQGADKTTSLPDGALLSGWVYTKLKEQYQATANQALLGDLTVELWHDSLPWTQKRRHIGFIGDEADAATLAKRLNAHIVIYGDYDPTQGLAIKFYANHELLRGDLDETSGNYQLGDPIQLQLPINQADVGQTSYINSEMTVRANALFWLTLALVYEIQNKPQKAFDLLKAHMPTDLPSGQRLFHFFMGREALILSDQAQDPNTQECSDTVYKHLATARDEFTAASKDAPTYIRPIIGLGGVYFDYAQCLPPEVRFESDELASGLATYQKALQLAKEQKESALIYRAQLGLGQMYQLQGDAFADSNQSDQAKQAYAQALTWLDPTIDALKPLEQYRLLTHAYLTRGIINEHQAEIVTDPAVRQSFYAKALADYGDCAKQSGALSTDIVLQSTAKLCQTYAKQVQQ